MKQNNILKRALSGLLAVVCVSGYIPVPAAASETADFCEHHPAHTAECGYAEAVGEVICSHEHDENCSAEVTLCLHEHNEECGYTEETPETSCNHLCTAENGCVTPMLNCGHADDGSCCYIAAQEESPCGYVCTECAPEESAASEETVPETEDTPTEPSVCTCEAVCTEDAVNGECAVCSVDYAVCEYVEAEEPTCTCEAVCAEDAVNGECAVCSVDYTLCEYVEAAEPACTCEAVCTEDAVNGECAVCSVDYAVCEYVEAEEPTCTCEAVCTEDAVNGECAVCVVDYAVCEYVEATEPICTCEAVCAEDAVNGECAVCVADYTVCEYVEVAEIDEAVENVRTMTGELPSAAELEAMETAAQDEIRVQLDNVRTTYDALTDEQKAELTEEAAVIEELEAYFESLDEITLYNIYVGSIQITEENADDILEDGKAAYNAETNTLTLTDAEIVDFYTTESGDLYGIYAAGDLTVVTAGTNTVAYEVHTDGELTLDGEGMLIVGIDETVTTVLSDYTLTEDITINGTWNFVNSAKIIAGDYTVTTAENAVVLVDGEEHIHNADGEVTYGKSEEDPASHLVITPCMNCPIGYAEEVEEQHYAVDETGVCVCGISTVAAAVENGITLGETLNVADIVGTTIVKIPFTPTFTHYYTFTSVGANGDTYGHIYDADGKELVKDDDTGGNRQFRIDYKLTAGTTYYLGVRWYSDSYSGTIPVLLTMGAHVFTEGDDGIYRCDCGRVAEDLTTETPLDVEITANETDVVRFVPTLDHSYKFTASDTENTAYLYIYNDAMTSLASTSGQPAVLSYTMTAGTVYNLGVRYSSTTVSGVIPLKVELANHNYVKQSDGTYLCNCGKIGDTIELHQVKDVEVLAKETVKIPFTPEITHSYIFAGTSAVAANGYIYRANSTSTLSSNIGSSTIPFITTATLTAGTTYHLGVYNSTDATIPVVLALGPHDFQKQEDGGYKCATCDATSDPITVGQEMNVTIPANHFVTIPYESAITHPCVFTGGDGADGDILAAVYSSVTNRLSATFTDPFSSIYSSYTAGNKYYLMVGNLSDTERTIPVKLDYFNHTYVKNEETGEFACSCGAVKDTVILGKVIDVDIAAGETVKLPFVPGFTHSYRYIGWSDKAITGYINSSSSNSNPYSWTYSMTADTTYNLGVYSQSENSAKILIDYNSHSFVQQDDGSYKCECGVGWSFDNGTLTISGEGGMGFYTSSSTTPWKDYTTQITSVVIEDGITSIGDYSFYGCTNLADVSIADSVVYIGNNAFNNCDKLTEIAIPESTEYIGYSAFYDCDGLTEVVVPDTVSYMGTSVFYGCSNLTSAKLPSGLTKIPDSTFRDCTKLTDVTLPENYTSIGASAFYNCDKLTEFTIPNTVVSIGSQAFYDCDGLADVTIPETVTSIGYEAFRGCDKLTEIVVPDSVTSMGTGVFYDCINLTTAKLPSGLTKIPDSTFYSCAKLTDVTLPENCTSIGASAFYNCDKLTEFTIPNTVVSIGYRAFYDCDGLADVTIPETVTSIGYEAFRGCDKLTEIVVPDSVTSMGTGVFMYCTNLTSAKLPKYIEKIPDSTFYSCAKLTDVTLPESYTSIGASAFYGCYGLTSIVIPEGATTIGNSAFAYCTSLNYVDIPDTVTSIGSNAFERCYGLDAIVIPSGVTSIGANAFYICNELDEVKFDTQNCTAASTAFSSCTDLKTLIIGKNVDVLTETFWDSGIAAVKEVKFEGENYFTTTDIPLSAKFSAPLKGLAAGNYYVDADGVLYRIEDDGSATLVYCPDGIENLTVPASVPAEDGTPCTVTKVGSYALKNADDLTEVTFESPESVTKLESFAMADCYKLASVNGQTSVTGAKGVFAAAEIGVNVFENTLLKDTEDETTPDFTVDGTLVTDPIEIKSTVEGAKPILSLTTKSGEYYTGESCETSIVISNAGNEGNRIRIYFQFSDTDGVIDKYTVGQYPVVSEAGNTYMFDMCATESDHIYYMEFDQPLAGDTFSVLVNTYYASPDSDGGSLRVWGEVLTKEESESIGNAIIKPTYYHQATWETLRDDFPISKTAYTPTAYTYPTLVGDGKEDGLIFVENLKYSVKMTREENLLKERDESGALTTIDRANNTTSLGNDYIKRFEYEDILTLPEGTYWRDGVIQAIKDKNYRILVNNNNYTYYYITLADGTELLLCTLYNSSDDYAYRSAQLALTDDESNIIIKWSRRNPYTNGESMAYSVDITYGSEVICADPEYIRNNIDTETGGETGGGTETENGGENKNLIFVFRNEVKVTEIYTHSEDVILHDDATIDVEVGEADIGLSKAPTDKFGSFGSRFGDRYNYKITVKNITALPYDKLESVYDIMPKVYYIKPDDMQRMFDMDKDDPRAVLSIQIEKATLCTVVAEGEVTAVDGNKYNVENANTGVNTEYHGTENIDSVDTLLADIILKWAADGESIDITVLNTDTEVQLHHFTVAADSEIDAENGRYPSIESALDSIGYLVTNSAVFTPTWTIAEGFTMIGGQEEDFYILSTLKDTFMYTNVDLVKEYGSSGWYCYNYAYATVAGVDAPKQTSHWNYIYRDFSLTKSGYVNGIQIKTDTDIEAGDVISNRLTLSHYTGNSDASAYYEILPLVDHLQGGQVLLVPLEGNEFLMQEPYNLKPDIYGEARKSYFVLDVNTIPEGEESRTFYGITLGGYLTHSIVITKSEANEEKETLSGLNTLIRWYLTDITGSMTKTLQYESLVDPDLAGCDEVKYWLNNEVWANDHQSHRLWYPIGEIPVIRMSFDKSIVTSRGATPAADSLASYSLLREGETVTYRFTIQNTGENASIITGNSIYDVLPSSIDNFWKKEDMTITYVDANGMVATDGSPTEFLTVVNGDKWEVTQTDGTSANARQQIRWDSTFELSFHKVVYIYVTIKCPADTKDENGNITDDIWTEFAGKYSNVRLANDLYVYQMMDSVYHDIAVPSEAVLYKGVYHTGIKAPGTRYSNYTYNTSENSRLYYENDGVYERLVFYYVTLYNSGDSRLYINDMQDILPKGFTFYGMLSNDYYRDSYIYNSSSGGNHYYSPSGNLMLLKDEDDSSIAWKYANITASTGTTDFGNQRITFKLSEYSSNSSKLQYDEYVGKYYLAPGEGVKFAYACRTNNEEATEDVATNSVVMPYYDHTGGGVEVSENVTVKGQARGQAKENDGGCELISTSTANGIGYEGGDADTQWLYSEVTLRRKSMLPGITKYAEGKAANAHITDTINWEVTAYNDGASTITDYIITDVMESPYEFVGTVKYTIDYTVYETSYKIISKLFDIDSANKDANGVIESFNIYSLTSSGSRQTMYTLTVGGDALTIESYYNGGSGLTNKITEIDVQLERDEEGNLELKLHFHDDAMSIPASGSALLQLSTKNTTAHQNKIYYNTAYLVPNGQIFDETAVTKGNVVTYDNMTSLQASCPITVSMGYVTSSEKSVEQADDTNNNASCNDAVNYIILPTKDTLFNYTLRVDNTTQQDMDNLILIDNLPEKGDHFTFASTKERNSKFTVVLADDPNFIITVKGQDGTPTVLTEDQYRIEYTDSVVFTADDWSGITHGSDVEGATVWYSEPKETTRSFRIVISAPEVTNENGSTKKVSNIPKDTSVYIQFTAKIHEDDKATVLPGEIAWNSFGYHYNLVNIAAELEAAPPEVGVMIPTAPKIKKELKLEGGVTPYTAVEDGVFRFLIYNGTDEDITLPAKYTEAELAAALADAERDYTYIELEVKQGESESAQLLLKDAVHYTYSVTDGWIVKLTEPTETTPDDTVQTDAASSATIPWDWVNGNEYTVIELPLAQDQEELVIGEISGNSDNSYTFTYDNSVTEVITAVNYRKLWNITMLKTDSVTAEGISGAVFALYSPDPADSVTDEQRLEWEELYDIDIPMTVTVKSKVEISTEESSSEDMADNSEETETETSEDTSEANTEEQTKTYYLVQIAVSGSSGQLQWTGLIHPEYCIRELMPPTGYNLDDTPIVVESEDYEDVTDITVINVMGYTLPETGGIGILPYTIGGALTVTSGLLGYVITKRKRKED